jgi:hypothetical protein
MTLIYDERQKEIIYRWREAHREQYNKFNNEYYQKNKVEIKRKKILRQEKALLKKSEELKENVKIEDIEEIKEN